ncbi:MAG: hypothetical protein ACRD2L_00635, partial [Terriglobia bacterium]
FGAQRTSDFESMFCAALEKARDSSNSSIREYRWHGDTARLVSELCERYGSLLKYAAYLLGHLDGLEQELSAAAPRAFELLEKTAYFRPIFERLSATLRSMHKTYGHWSGKEVFDPLYQVGESLLNSAGIEIQRRPGGAAYVNVPFTPQTTAL